MNLPGDIANQAIDAIGYPFTIGDLEEGTRPAQILLRAYRQCLMQLLRAAHWDFARKTAPLNLLADASGNTPYVGTIVPQPWIYEYEYPIDCMKARFLPWNWENQASTVPLGNAAIPATPLVTGLGQQTPNGRIQPARFLVATDFNYPPTPGQITWEVQGVSPEGRTVILTNVRYATLVYTALMLYPSVWDALFRAAMVAYLAAEVALPIWAEKDRKFGLQVRTQQVAILKAKVQEARKADGNEGGPSTSDIAVDWMRARVSGGPATQSAWGGGWNGAGVLSYGWDALSLPGGAVF